MNICPCSQNWCQTGICESGSPMQRKVPKSKKTDRSCSSPIKLNSTRLKAVLKTDFEIMIYVSLYPTPLCCHRLSLIKLSCHWMLLAVTHSMWAWSAICCGMMMSWLTVRTYVAADAVQVIPMYDTRLNITILSTRFNIWIYGRCRILNIQYFY